MAILRITASADNTITNAFNQTLNIRGTGSNMGASDILETFTIYAQASTSSVEKSRILIQFPLNKITELSSSGVIPAAGSREFHLCLKNAPHSEAVPDDFKLFVSPVSQSWEEGFGLDMAEYSDLTYDKEGSNWINAAQGTTWTTQGGDYLYDQTITASFPTGIEDLEENVTSIVEDWLLGSSGGQYNNYGFGIQLSPSEEAETKSYYTKKFFGRGSEYYLNRPYLEVRWNDTTKDDRGSFYASSSLAPAADNLNSIYLYNRIRGRLKDIPSMPTSASIRTTAADSSTELDLAAVTKVSTGIYVAEVSASTTASTVYDVWYSGSTAYHTGTISVKSFASDVLLEDTKYVVSVVNNQHEYRKTEKPRFKIYSRYKNWSPNIYTVAQNKPENLIIEDAIYRVVRIVDGEEIIPYDSSSIKSTQLSYNVSGNYFDLDMAVFESNYQYGIKLAFYNEYMSNYVEQPYVFKFRVVD